ncbi:MAG: serine/threonine protein kinase [Actinobacteria bacterium]|nr:serine/threonine protein kinase [Actinomycetota bacterium]
MTAQLISNRYEIEKELGSGGMATVFLATDLKTNRKVAIKFLHPQYARDASYIERFIREAETAIQLNHPNIVKVLDYGSQKSEHFIVMEYVDGKNVAEIIKDEGTLPEERALPIAQSVAEALDYADSFEIIHRDIKPQNLMLTGKDTIKVADFGIAKVASMATVTHTGMFVGSPTYASPEQAKGARVDIRSDIYSLGVTLYEMLEGCPPFQSDNPLSVVNMHITKEPPIIDAGIAPDIKEILIKCLKKDPDERYQKPAELASSISELFDARNKAKEIERVDALETETVIFMPGGDAMGSEVSSFSAGSIEDTVNQSAKTAILQVSDTRLDTKDKRTAIAKGLSGESRDSAETKASQPNTKAGKNKSSPKSKVFGLLTAIMFLMFLLSYVLSDSQEPTNATDKNISPVTSSTKALVGQSTTTTKPPTTTTTERKGKRGAKKGYKR